MRKGVKKPLFVKTCEKSKVINIDNLEEDGGFQSMLK